MGDIIGSYVNLPPGFKFCPTDEELVLHFLYPKAFLLPSQYPNIIPDIDHLHLHNPWDFNGSNKALSSENMYYFFSKIAEQRVSANGYWKELDDEKDEPIIVANCGDNQVGLKKCFVFYVGESQTNWLMEEFRLCNNIDFINGSSIVPAYKKRRNQKSEYSKWVLCRVHERKGSSSNINAGSSGQNLFNDQDDNGTELSCLDEIFFSLLDDDLDEITMQNI